MSAAATPNRMNRRGFLKTSLAGATGLVVGFYLPSRAEAFTMTSAEPQALNAWIHITPEDVVTIVCDKSEMGQGILTSMTMLAADELDCDWSRVRWEFALAEPVYTNPAFHAQYTAGSASTRTAYEPMRRAGATARAMLVQAAAKRWGVSPSECRTAKGRVLHPAANRSLTYGSLAVDAAKLPQPTDVPLKDPSQFILIGKPTKRLDTPLKVDGSAQYGLDVRRPGMVYAVVTRCPVFGGKVANFDASKAKAVPGVTDVIQISNGVAVIAGDTWTAMQGKKALEIQWDEGTGASLTSENIMQSFAQQAAGPSPIARKEGNGAAGLANAAQKLEAVYEAPYLSHSPMEPMNCTADVHADGAEIWVPTQVQTAAQGSAAKILGVRPEAVILHTTFLGGGFGRRESFDYVGEAVQISKAIGKPVKVTWTREDDMQHDVYRPLSYCKFVAGLDAQGKPTAFTARVACQSVTKAAYGSVKDGLDPGSVEGVADIAYDIPDIQINYALTDNEIPVFFWRSVGFSQNGFFRECFVDELAAAAKEDPYEFRRRLLAKAPPRLSGVLNLAAEKAGWGTPLPAGRSRGIAVLNPLQSYNAQVVEVSVDRQAKTYRVHRVVVAMDCGQTVNPSTVVAQMESGVIWAMSMLKDEITIDKGRVVQTNFNNYQMARINETPKIEVYIVPSTEKPTGVGEPGVPCLAPAVCNAIFQATGRRIRRLPIRPEDLA
jgi:isoquinoline 1-oxidoreductase subunit beta